MIKSARKRNQKIRKSENQRIRKSNVTNHEYRKSEIGKSGNQKFKGQKSENQKSEIRKSENQKIENQIIKIIENLKIRKSQIQNYSYAMKSTENRLPFSWYWVVGYGWFADYESQNVKKSQEVKEVNKSNKFRGLGSREV